MLIRVRGRGRGLRIQEGAGHPLSTHTTLNYNIATGLGLKKSKCIEITYIKHPQQGAENAGGGRAPF